MYQSCFLGHDSVLGPLGLGTLGVVGPWIGAIALIAQPSAALAEESEITAIQDAPAVLDTSGDRPFPAQSIPFSPPDFLQLPPDAPARLLGPVSAPSGPSQFAQESPPSTIIQDPTEPSRQLDTVPRPGQPAPPIGVPATPTDGTGESEVLGDPELGVIRVRPLPTPTAEATPPTPPPALYLLGNATYFSSDNIFSIRDPIADGLIQTGLELWGVYPLSSRTALIGSVGGNLVRYQDQSEFDYNELRFEASVRHALSPRMYGEVGWSNQNLFYREGGDRFLNDHALRLALGRTDPLTDKLALDTLYQLQVSFADPDNRSRILNSLGASLRYDVTEEFQASLAYQLGLSNFTESDRDDFYQQLLGVLNYQFSERAQLTVYGGYRFGNSSNDLVDFDGGLVGVSLGFNLPLF
ncbi:hypothetical protein [Geitlerinema sp. PCC 7407]|uniref:hypothetical protein n=1 Tax=Geitlerinema sp. PCC 7407 TaxID=1173025 RepID=UPI00029FE536|nr:hypothetical protein [Geitlerinema sp. PCC 7407]AFY67155.1 hypothetical protein GEI7407_2682 [Geitlerinema sp. PCC 7407]